MQKHLIGCYLYDSNVITYEMNFMKKLAFIAQKKYNTLFLVTTLSQYFKDENIVLHSNAVFFSVKNLKFFFECTHLCV